MPTFKCEPLETLAREIFCAIHVPAASAAWMASSWSAPTCAVMTPTG